MIVIISIVHFENRIFIICVRQISYFLNVVTSSWDSAIGKCVDVLGKEKGGYQLQERYTEEKCLEYCKKHSTLNGCTWHKGDDTCITYDGNIEKGNGDKEYKCHYRMGKMNIHDYIQREHTKP